MAQVKLAISEDVALNLAGRSHSIFEADRFEWLPFNSEHVNDFIIHGHGPLADRNWIVDSKLAFQETWRMWNAWNGGQPEAPNELSAAPPATVLPHPAEDTIRTDRICYVTLNQMAAIVNRSKRTLERMKTRRTNPLPGPDVEGGGGRPDEWIWSEVRPWLEKEFSKQLPERYPAHRH